MSVTIDLSDRGWFQLNLDGVEHSQSRELLRLREVCADQFLDLVQGGHLDSAQVTPTGQFGFTREGTESQVGVSEVRSHLVFNQSVPADHPLAVFSPHFYGVTGSDVPAPFLAINDTARRLHEILDYYTLDVAERLESELGLAFGDLARRLVMGERLLRIQWYPRLPNGDLAELTVEYEGRPITITGVHRRHLGSDEFCVRVGPHSDIGHWTWQVFATDSQLRFLDKKGNRVYAPTGPWLYGNVCEFLSDDYGALVAPIHWVDLSYDAQMKDRISISYFAHTRPTSRSADGEFDGMKLYRSLESLDYVSQHDCNLIQEFLKHEDLQESPIVAGSLSWEGSYGGPPSGFAVGVSRYFLGDGSIRSSAPGPLEST